MDIERKIELIKRPPTEEVITEEELRALLETKDHPVAYNGFEPSGLAHLGTGLITALKVKDLTEAGCKFILFLADWHAWVNEKLGGEIENIRKCGEYLKEVWLSLGVDPNKVEFVFGTDVYQQDYWNKVIKIARNMTLHRAMRSLTIAGRRGLDTLMLHEFALSILEKEKREECPLCGNRVESLPSKLKEEVSKLHKFGIVSPKMAMYFYTPMQVADIFHLGVDICQLGIDQRRANMLAREIGPTLGYWKPVCVHHHLLMGLQGPQKMGFEEDAKLDMEISSKESKSIPGTAIFVHDPPEVIESKIHNAYCPEKDPLNPVMEIAQYIIMRDGKTPLTIETKKHGELVFERYYELEEAYEKGIIHPLELKKAISDALSKILEPCRRHFTTSRKALELLQFVEKTVSTPF
ncbi:MAG: tyrosine--tRNA ligase [candidate division WOR-3 bacterium]